MSIVVLGAVFVDIKGYPNDIYIPGGRNSGRVEQVHGGVSRNIAEDVANIGLPSRFLSLVDDTSAGTEVIERLNRHGVDTTYMLRTKDGMGTWLAIFDNTGDVIAAISKRPDLLPLAGLLDEKGGEIFRDAESALLEIDLDAETTARVMDYAEKNRFPVYAAVSNMSIAKERVALLRRCDCLVCNLQEAGLLFEKNYDGYTPEELLRLLPEAVREFGLQRMVVTLAEKGAVYVDRDGKCGHCPAESVTVVDTTGAGDAFFAGFAAGMTRGKTMAESCRIGTHLAATVICSTENVCPVYGPEEFGLREEN